MLVGSVATACFIAACADIFGIHNAEVDASAGDASLDVPPDYVLYDKIPIDVNTASCDGGIPVLPADQAFWVSGKTGDDGPGCGTQAKPCKTLSHLLPLIADGGPETVYLDDSNFKEQLDLGSAYRNFTIQGGFVIDAGVWIPACANNITSITSPDDGGATTVYVHDQPDGGMTLRLLQIETKTNGAVGESVYAVLVMNSNVLLDNVNLYAQNGGPGAFGNNGNTPNGCNTSGGGTGAHGADAGPGAAGNFTATKVGYVPNVAGNGTNGDLGTWTSGFNGACNSSCVTGCF